MQQPPAPAFYGRQGGYGNRSPYAQPGAYGDPQPAASATTNGLAIAAVVLGIVWMFGVGSVFALVLGYRALSQIRKRGGGGRGIAIAAITLGWIGIVALILAVVGVVAVGRQVQSAESSVTAQVAAPSAAVDSVAPAATQAPPTTAPGCTAKAPVPASPAANFPLLPPGTDPALGVAPTITIPAGAVPTAIAWTDIVVGSGAKVAAADSVTVNYVIADYVDCRVINSTWAHAQEQTFELRSVIPGFQRGVVDMRVGGRRQIVVAPSLAYGSTGLDVSQVQIPGHGQSVTPNEEVVFVVDVLADSPGPAG